MYTKLAPSLGGRLSKQVLVIPSNIKDRNVPESWDSVGAAFLDFGDSFIDSANIYWVPVRY